MPNILSDIYSEVDKLPACTPVGKVVSVKGSCIEISGLEQLASVGSRCQVFRRSGEAVECEVIGAQEEIIRAMPFAGSTDDIGVGCKVKFTGTQALFYPSDEWLGRVVNAFGEPIDGKGPLSKGNKAYTLHTPPPAAHDRRKVTDKLDMGIRAINTFLTCCRGQRMGIFAGSGVGKSMLLAMLTKFAQTDIKVIGLIGERGREVQEFIEEYLGPEGLAKAVVVVATSDEPALTRRQAAYLTMSISEYYRDRGMEVLCLMDSVTRFAMAQREIGLAMGEPPTTKSYTPTVFSELPRLLERAGPGAKSQGDITGLFSVLVEGDDHNEPVADAVRGILDGHIVLDRDIAARGIYPAIDIAKSVSRTMPRCNTEQENEIVMKAKNLLTTYNDMADLIRIGAYKKGSDPQVDKSIKLYPNIEKFIIQCVNEKDTLKGSYQKLSDAISKGAE